MSDAIALPVYGVLLAGAALAVWARPIVALYLFLLGLALHNLVMSLLYGAGVRGTSLDLIQAWKEILLAVAVCRVASRAARERQLPVRPGPVDWVALTFASLVVLYALIPQGALGGHASAKAIAYAARHDLVPLVAYFLGRSLPIGVAELRRLGLTLLGAAAALATFGLVDIYAIPIEWWRRAGAVGYFHRELGFDYHGPGGLPENFAFNTSDGLFRRLVSAFVSPLASAYLLVVALLLSSLVRGRLRWPLATLVLAGLLFTFSRSSIVALAIGLVALALATRRACPLPVAAAVLAAGLGFAAAYPSIAPRTHWFASDLPYQEAQAKAKGPLPKDTGLEGTYSLGEPSIKSHLTSLRDGLETIGRHPQGYGLGNAGATAQRFDVPLEAGESNYTEIGVEAGLTGMLVFIAWSLSLLAGLVRSAWTAPDPTVRLATAGLAAALAAVLALGIQTDAYGVPWLGYCVWWLSGALLVPAAMRAATPRPRLTSEPCESPRRA